MKRFNRFNPRITNGFVKNNLNHNVMMKGYNGLRKFLIFIFLLT